MHLDESVASHTGTYFAVRSCIVMSEVMVFVYSVNYLTNITESVKKQLSILKSTGFRLLLICVNYKRTLTKNPERFSEAYIRTLGRFCKSHTLRSVMGNGLL